MRIQFDEWLDAAKTELARRGVEYTDDACEFLHSAHHDFDMKPNEAVSEFILIGDFREIK